MRKHRPTRSELAPFEGDWLRVVPRDSYGDEMLSILPNSRFKSTWIDDDGHERVAEGSVEVRTVDIPSLGFCSALIFKSEPNPDPRSGQLSTPHLVYDSEVRALTDFTTSAFARSDDAFGLKCMLADRDHQQEYAPFRSGVGEWRRIWAVAIPEEDWGSGVAALDLRSIAVEGSHLRSQGSDYRHLIATSREDGILVLDEHGRERYQIECPGLFGGQVFWVVEEGLPRLISCRSWGSPMRKFSLDGACIWSLRPTGGVDCIAPVRLDSRTMGIVIGFNGDGGVEILDVGGSSIRKISGPGNVWSVCSAQIGRDEPALVLCVGVDPQTYLSLPAAAFSLAGAQLAIYEPPGEVFGVFGADIDGDHVDEVLTLASTVVSGWNLSAFSMEGQLQWSVKLDRPIDLFKSPLFTLNLHGKLAIAVADERGVTFYSTSGVRIGRLSMHISGATPLPSMEISDRLLLRGPGFLRCYQLPDR